MKKESRHNTKLLTNTPMTINTSAETTKVSPKTNFNFQKENKQISKHGDSPDSEFQIRYERI